MVDWTRVDRLEEVWSAAKEACEKPQYNLILAYEFQSQVIDSAFVQSHRATAEKWMSSESPRSLHFTHGQYFRGNEGTNYIVDELHKKETSRRALLSLMSMKDLIGSHDSPIPAFILLQFGIAGDTLYATAYFRALEVDRFLPINLTEICLHCSLIRQKMPHIERIRLLVVAFRAYRDPKFPCLEKAKLDQEEHTTIGIAVAKKDYTKLRDWIDSKRQADSAIVVSGLEALVNAVGQVKQDYGEPFYEALENALSRLKDIKRQRETTSEGGHLERLNTPYLEHLEVALRLLREREDADGK